MILNRYLQLHIVRPFLMITLVITSMVWMAQAFRILDLIVSRGIELADFMMIAILLLPSLMLLLLPIAALVTTIYVLYHMYTERELVICKSLGLSSWQMANPMLQVIFLITILSYLNSTIIVPHSYKQFKDMQDYFRNNYAALLLQDGSFNSPISGLTVYVEEKQGDDVRGIFVYDTRSETKQTTITAARGKVIKTANSAFLELQDGTHQEKNLKNGKLSILTFKSYSFNLQLIGQNEKVRSIDPNELNLVELWQRIHTAEDAATISKAEVNFHQRLTWPLYTLSLSILMMALLIASPEYSRRLPTLQYIKAAIIGGLILVLAVLSTNFGTRYPVCFAFTYAVQVIVIAWSLRRLFKY